jgi:hypothetical protein
MKRSHGKTDANSKELDAYAESLGVQLIKCSEFAELGFDRIYLFKPSFGPGETFLVEYKNPTRRWTLTPTEQTRREQCLRVGVHYNVIECPAQIADMLGVPYIHQEAFSLSFK